MKTEKDKKIKKYIKHLDQFMTQMNLFPKSKRIILSVSGGMDSMALLSLLVKLNSEKKYFSSIDVVHFNHGTRKENKDEQNLVKAYCVNNSLKYYLMPLSFSEINSNFEMNARSKRYEALSQLLKDGDLIYTGHHIDDSFEWSLMQKFKSSSIRSSLGIPVINGTTARPLMCFTKNQIRHYVKKFNVPYLDDPSNHLITYERNYMRNIIIKAIKKRYPAYLKHYVHQATTFANDLHLARKKRVNSEYVVVREALGGIAVVDQLKNGFEGATDLIEKLIFECSTKSRGSTKKEVLKLIEAIKNNRKGPMSFSGGVKIFLEKNWIYVISKENIKKIDQIDQDLSHEISNYHLLEDINGVIINNRFFRSSVYLKSLTIKTKGPKQIHPLFPKLTKKIVDKEYCYHFQLEAI